MNRPPLLHTSWLPLLPAAITKAATFKPGSAEAALSVVLELSATGELEHYRFCRSTIKADGLVDPNALQALAERKPKARTTPAALKALKDQLPLLEQLIALAGLLHQQGQFQNLGGGSRRFGLVDLLLERFAQACGRGNAPQQTLQGCGQGRRGQHGEFELAQGKGIAHRRALQTVHQAVQPKQSTEHQAQERQQTFPSRGTPGGFGGAIAQAQGTQVSPDSPLSYDGPRAAPDPCPSGLCWSATG